MVADRRIRRRKLFSGSRGLDGPAPSDRLNKNFQDKAQGEKPNPITRIFSEGRLHSDPEKTRSLAARRDLFKIEALGYAYALTDNVSYGTKAREFVLAWARLYESDGNPINETEFVRLMKGYDLARELFSLGISGL